MENRENLEVKISKIIDDNRASLNEDYKDLLSKALDVITKQSDYDIREKELNVKYRFLKFISILLFVIVLWAIFYFMYFNASVQIDKSYRNENINYNENVTRTEVNY